ncbi:MAG: hypothetical protein WBX02_00870, partial [Terriglobales bacterium]
VRLVVWPTKLKNRWLQPRRWATRRARRAIFAVAAVVADAVEKAAIDLGAANVQSKSEPNLVLRIAVTPLAKHGTNLATKIEETKQEVKPEKEETTASTAAIARDVAAPTRDFSAPRPPVAWAATMITDLLRDTSRSCCPANRSRNTST